MEAMVAAMETGSEAVDWEAKRGVAVAWPELAFQAAATARKEKGLEEAVDLAPEPLGQARAVVRARETVADLMEGAEEQEVV